jgi:hypothetical protein
MSATYQIWLAEADTTRIKQLLPTRIDFVHVVGDVGAFSITLPSIDEEAALLIPDRRIEIMRRPAQGLPIREYYGFIQTVEPSTDERGKPQLVLSGHDATGLLDRRMVVDSNGDLFLSLSAKEVDDAMKDAIRDNLTNATDTDRNVGIITVDPDLTAGVQITRDFANISLINLLQDLQAFSRAQSAELFWGLRQNGSNWDFFTSTGQYGRDRTDTGDSPLVFGNNYRNVTNVRESVDYSNIKSVVYALGSGVDADRAIREFEDTSRTSLSIYGRREMATYAVNSDDNTALDDAANDALAYTRTQKRLLCDILDTRVSPYGTLSGWLLGDKITTVINGSRRDAIIRAVRVTVDGRGRETIRGSVEILE